MELVTGFLATRRRRNIPMLMAAYALTAGVSYIAFFVNFDPDLPESARDHSIVVILIGIGLGIAMAGLFGSTVA